MSTVTRTRRRVKPARSIRWLSRPEGSIPGLVAITSPRRASGPEHREHPFGSYHTEYRSAERDPGS
jgi:hypothetical protein